MPIAPIQVVLCKHRVHHHRHHHGPRQIQFPIAIAAQPVPHFPRLRALALFSRRPPHRVVRPSFRRPKTCTSPDMPYDTAEAAMLEFEETEILDRKSNCAGVGNFQPNLPTAMTASVRFDALKPLSIAVT